jgi:hypothetical protein
MESLTRLVSESLARHGFDRPLDYRRLHWSRWFRCESHHSLLLVPSKPGVFALAEEIMDFEPGTTHGGEDAFVRPASTTARTHRRMLAVTQFFEDDDMAFVLDRMLTRQNPMYARLTSGRYFVRFVVIEDESQRLSICNALNQWIANSAEKTSGIGSHFASSLELTPATEYVPQPNDAQASLFENANVGRTLPSTSSGQAMSANAARVPEASQAAAASPKPSAPPITAPQLDSGAATNIHCPSPFPSGF